MTDESHLLAQTKHITYKVLLNSSGSLVFFGNQQVYLTLPPEGGKCLRDLLLYDDHDTIDYVLKWGEMSEQEATTSSRQELYDLIRHHIPNDQDPFIILMLDKRGTLIGEGWYRRRTTDSVRERDAANGLMQALESCTMKHVEAAQPSHVEEEQQG